MFHTRVEEKIKTRTLYSIPLFRKSGLYDITWKNMVQPDRAPVKIRHMCVACRITKATDTHSEYVGEVGVAPAGG